MFPGGRTRCGLPTALRTPESLRSPCRYAHVLVMICTYSLGHASYSMAVWACRHVGQSWARLWFSCSGSGRVASQVAGRCRWWCTPHHHLLRPQTRGTPRSASRAWAVRPAQGRRRRVDLVHATQQTTFFSHAHKLITEQLGLEECRCRCLSSTQPSGCHPASGRTIARARATQTARRCWA